MQPRKVAASLSTTLNFGIDAILNQCNSSSLALAGSRCDALFSPEMTFVSTNSAPFFPSDSAIGHLYGHQRPALPTVSSAALQFWQQSALTDVSSILFQERMHGFHEAYFANNVPSIVQRVPLAVSFRTRSAAHHTPAVVSCRPHPGASIREGKRKKTWTRAVFSSLQRKGLERSFIAQQYISKKDRRKLAATLGLTDSQVRIWYANRRMKAKKSSLPEPQL